MTNTPASIKRLLPISSQLIAPSSLRTGTITRSATAITSNPAAAIIEDFISIDAAAIISKAPAMAMRPLVISFHFIPPNDLITSTIILRATPRTTMPTLMPIKFPPLPTILLKIASSNSRAPIDRMPFCRSPTENAPKSETTPVKILREAAIRSIETPAVTPKPFPKSLDIMTISPIRTPTDTSPLPRVFRSIAPRADTLETSILTDAANASRPIPALTRPPELALIGFIAADRPNIKAPTPVNPLIRPSHESLDNAITEIVNKSIDIARMSITAETLTMPAKLADAIALSSFVSIEVRDSINKFNAIIAFVSAALSIRLSPISDIVSIPIAAAILIKVPALREACMALSEPVIPSNISPNPLRPSRNPEPLLASLPIEFMNLMSAAPIPPVRTAFNTSNILLNPTSENAFPRTLFIFSTALPSTVNILSKKLKIPSDDPPKPLDICSLIHSPSPASGAKRSFNFPTKLVIDALIASKTFRRPSPFLIASWIFVKKSPRVAVTDKNPPSSGNIAPSKSVANRTTSLTIDTPMPNIANNPRADL